MPSLAIRSRVTTLHANAGWVVLTLTHLGGPLAALRCCLPSAYTTLPFSAPAPWPMVLWEPKSSQRCPVGDARLPLLLLGPYCSKRGHRGPPATRECWEPQGVPLLLAVRPRTTGLCHSGGDSRRVPRVAQFHERQSVLFAAHICVPCRQSHTVRTVRTALLADGEVDDSSFLLYAGCLSTSPQASEEPSAIARLQSRAIRQASAWLAPCSVSGFH